MDLALAIAGYLRKTWNNRNNYQFLSIFLFLWIIVFLFCLIPFLRTIKEVLEISNILEEWILLIKYGILSLGTITILIVWSLWRKLPKFKKGDVGIYLVSNPGFLPVLNEIIDRLKSDLQLKLGLDAKVVILKSDLHYREIEALHRKIEQQNYGEGEIRNFQEKTNSSYVLLFQSDYRNTDLIEIKNIKQIVFHRTTNQSNRELLRKDLSFILGKNIDIPIKSEREQLDRITHNIAPFIKYIASVIDFLGGKDFKSCRDRLEKLLNGGLTGMSSQNANLLRNKINILISTTYQEEVNMIIEGFHDAGSYPKDRLEELLACNEKGSAYYSSYELKLQKAIIYFLIDFNTERARKCIKKAQGYAGEDQSWRASLIFLDLLDGEYSQVFEQIKKMRKYTLYTNTGLSIIYFNNSILRNCSGYGILLFWNAVVAKLFLTDQKLYQYYKDFFLKQNTVSELSHYLNSL